MATRLPELGRSRDEKKRSAVLDGLRLSKSEGQKREMSHLCPVSTRTHEKSMRYWSPRQESNLIRVEIDRKPLDGHTVFGA